MKLSVVPIPVNSPRFPLPEDYDDLTVEGQAAARINACRQWTLEGEPDEKAARLIGSTWFFDVYYLHPDEEADFDPLFYDMPPLVTPEHHWDLSRMWATSPLTVAMAPRGSAKTTHIKKDTLLRGITWPGYTQVYATSTHDNAEVVGQSLRDQCFENSRIQDDWGPEYGVSSLKPRRGMKPMGIGFFYLNNNSYVRCISAESRLRGMRPRRFRVDDPEYDKKSSTSVSLLRDYTERLIFNVGMPAVMRARSGIDWVGTFVSRKHFLWHAMRNIEVPGQAPVAADPRFRFWERLIIRAGYPDPETGELRSVWPEMWPATIKEKKAKGIKDKLSLEEWKVILGKAFDDEMMGMPSDSDNQFFKLDTGLQGKHAWWLEGVDEMAACGDLFSSNVEIAWRHPRTDEVVRQPLRDFLKEGRRFLTVDTAYTEKTTSDRRCVMLMQMHRDNILFVLDGWSDQKPDNDLMLQSFALCDKWRCPIIGVEVVRDSFKLFKRFEQAVYTRLTEDIGAVMLPGVRPIKPGTMSKTAKIATLDTRFDHGLIKLPVWQRYKTGWWNRLFEQIENFHPEQEDGGLDKDDEIDCVAMSMLVVRGRIHIQDPSQSKLDKADPVQMMKEGKFTHPDGTSVGTGIPWQMIDPESMRQIMEASQRISGSALRVSSTARTKSKV